MRPFIGKSNEERHKLLILITPSIRLEIIANIGNGNPALLLYLLILDR